MKIMKLTKLVKLMKLLKYEVVKNNEAVEVSKVIEDSTLLKLVKC